MGASQSDVQPVSVAEAEEVGRVGWLAGCEETEGAEGIAHNTPPTPKRRVLWENPKGR